MPDNNPFVRVRPETRARQFEYRIVLECGCAVMMRDKPMNANTRYACRSNLDHGYRLRWKSWSSKTSDYVRTNGIFESEAGEQSVLKHEPRPRAACESVRFSDLAVGDRIHFATQSAGGYSRTWRDGTVQSFSSSGASLRVLCDDGGSSRIDRSGYGNRMVKRYT